MYNTTMGNRRNVLSSGAVIGLFLLASCTNKEAKIDVLKEPNSTIASSMSDLPMKKAEALVTFVEPGVQIRERGNLGKLILRDGCILVQLQNAGLEYIPIFEKGTQLTHQAEKVVGVIIAKQVIELDVLFRFTGSKIKDPSLIPEITKIPDNCSAPLHTLRSIKK